jgi:hypothetical protein
MLVGHGNLPAASFPFRLLVESVLVWHLWHFTEIIRNSYRVGRLVMSPWLLTSKLLWLAQTLLGHIISLPWIVLLIKTHH